MTEPKLCPICDTPMVAEDIEMPSNPGEKTPVWHCTNPDCINKIDWWEGRDKANPYLRRYEEIKEPENPTYHPVHLGSIDNPAVAEIFFCPICDNEVDLIDGVYYIWTCPNCLILRSGGLRSRFYPIVNDEIDLEHEIRNERRLGAFWDPFYEGEDDDTEDDSDD